MLDILVHSQPIEQNLSGDGWVTEIFAFKKRKTERNITYSAQKKKYTYNRYSQKPHIQFGKQCRLDI